MQKAILHNWHLIKPNSWKGYKSVSTLSLEVIIKKAKHNPLRRIWGKQNKSNEGVEWVRRKNRDNKKEAIHQGWYLRA